MIGLEIALIGAIIVLVGMFGKSGRIVVVGALMFFASAPIAIFTSRPHAEQAPQVTAEQITAVEKDFADAAAADVVRVGDVFLVIDRVKRYGDETVYYMTGPVGSTRFFTTKSLARDKAKFIKKGDTPEYNLAARQYLWDIVHHPF